MNPLRNTHFVKSTLLKISAFIFPIFFIIVLVIHISIANPTKSSNSILKNNLTAPTQSQNVVVTSTPTDPYTGWQSFAMTGKYSVKIPGGWYDVRNDYVKTAFPNDLIFSNESIPYPYTPSSNGIVVQILMEPITSISDDLNNIAFNSSIGQIKTGSIQGANMKVNKLASSTIQGDPEVEYVIDTSDSSGNGSYDIHYVIKKGTEYYIAQFTLINKKQFSVFQNQIDNIFQSLTINN